MHLIGRWQRCVPYGALGWGLPLILDTTTHRLAPAGPPDWECWRGQWLPAIRGGVGLRGSTDLLRWGVGTLTGVASAVQATVALDSAYTHNSAGDACGMRLRLLSAKTLTHLAYHITAFTGTAANVNDIEVELRNSTSNKPGTTAHAAATHNPASTTGWHVISGLSFAASADTDYWLSVADPDGNATDYATVLSHLSVGMDVHTHLLGDRMEADTANGWSTTTLRAFAGSFVAGFSDGSALGQPITAVAASTNNTNRRGLFLSGMTEQLKILGIVSGSSSAQLSGVELWEGTTGPSGTPFATGAHEIYSAASSTAQGYFFGTPPTLAKATQARLVFTYSGAAATPRKMSIGTGADAVLRAAMPGKGSWYWAGANGTTDWSGDDQDAWPQVMVLFENQVEVASGPFGGGFMAAP